MNGEQMTISIALFFLSNIILMYINRRFISESTRGMGLPKKAAVILVWALLSSPIIAIDWIEKTARNINRP